MVFAGLYPIEETDYEGLRDALEKLRLNDSAFNYEPETSLALGYGFRCGFLGMLHMEIVQERLEREFNLSLIITAPSVQYRILTTAGEVLDIDNPSKLPTPSGSMRTQSPSSRAPPAGGGWIWTDGALMQASKTAANTIRSRMAFTPLEPRASPVWQASAPSRETSRAPRRKDRRAATAAARTSMGAGGSETRTSAAFERLWGRSR